MVGALTDPFDGGHMSMTAENVAAGYHVSQDGTPSWSRTLRAYGPSMTGRKTASAHGYLA
jgi:hypothetical protein